MKRGKFAQPNNVIYSTLIKGFGKVKNLERAKELYTKSKKKQYFMFNRTYDIG